MGPWAGTERNLAQQRERGGFQLVMGVTNAGWFLLGKIPEMDDEQGYHHLWKLPKLVLNIIGPVKIS